MPCDVLKNEIQRPYVRQPGSSVYLQQNLEGAASTISTLEWGGALTAPSPAAGQGLRGCATPSVGSEMTSSMRNVRRRKSRKDKCKNHESKVTRAAALVAPCGMMSVSLSAFCQVRVRAEGEAASI